MEPHLCPSPYCHTQLPLSAFLTQILHKDRPEYTNREAESRDFSPKSIWERELGYRGITDWAFPHSHTLDRRCHCNLNAAAQPGMFFSRCSNLIPFSLSVFVSDWKLFTKAHSTSQRKCFAVLWGCARSLLRKLWNHKYRLSTPQASLFLFTSIFKN